MSTSKADITSAYPLPSYNYRVTVDGGTTMSFSEVSGLNIEYENAIYKHGFSWVMGSHIIRGQAKPVNVTLKRGIVKKRDYLYSWLKSANKRDIVIDLCDEKGLPLVSWEISRAMPLKLDAPSFSADANEVAIESLELIAHNLKLSYH